MKRYKIALLSFFQVVVGFTQKLTIIIGSSITRFRRFHDVKEILDTLDTQHSLLHAIINSSTDIIIFSLDRDYRYTAFNEKHRAVMKIVWNSDIEIGMNLLKCMHDPELRKSAKQSMDRALNGESFIEVQHQPGPDIYYEFNWNPIFQSKAVIGITAFIRDISRQKHAEAQILKLNRIYSVLSNINQAIVRVHDPRAMLKEACRIAVEYGKFKMAWIGMLNFQTQYVDVVASCGDSGEYLNKINIDLNEPSGSWGPAGITFKTGKHEITNNISLDNGITPWQKDALQNGYKSSASFPLIVHENVLGTFNLYADETGFFHEEDINLLDEMAIDISFALEFIESEIERKRNDAINTAQLKLIHFATTHTLDELLEETLNEAEKLTGSLIGFYHFIEDDQVSLTLQNWSTRTKSEFCKAEGKGQHYAISQAGVWIDCVAQRKPVIHNNYASLPHRKGLPEGHAEVIRELVVPVLRGEKIKAVLGVGNKPTDYVEKDVEAISLLAELAWEIAERKQAEESLQKSEEKYRAVADFTYDWETWIGTDGNFIYVSPSCKQITGYPREDFMHDSSLFVKLVHPDERAIVEKHIKEISKGNISEHYIEFRIIAQSGEEHWIEHICQSIFTPDGKFLGQRASNRDITARKQAEKALRENEHKLGEAARIAHVGYWDRDLAAQTIILSDEACQIFGIPVDSFSHKLSEWHVQWLKLIHPDDQEKTAMAVIMALEGGPPYNVDYRVVRPNGDIRYVHSFAEVTKDTSGKPIRMFGTMIDVTERKEYEQKLKLLNFALNNVHDEAYLIDERSCFTYVNDESCRALGYSREELLKMNVADIDPDVPFERWLEHWNEIIKNGSTVFITRHRAKDGRIYPVEISANYFEYNGQGYNLALARDITERKRVEDALIFVAQRGWQAGTESFFDALAQFLGEKLDMDYVLIDKIDKNPEMAETVALYAKGEIIPNMHYALKGTPCENVMGRQLCVYPHSIQQLFPEDTLLSGMGAESYIGIPLWDSTGQPIGLIAMMGIKPLPDDAPVTQLLQLVATRAAAELERKQSEEEILKLNQDLEQRIRERTAQLESSNKELEAFAYSVSHDLRAPLRGIDGFSQVLLEEYQNNVNEQGRNYLQRIRLATQRMAQLIDDILSLSRISRSEMNIKQVDLSKIAWDVANDIKETQPGRQVEFIIHKGIITRGDGRLFRIVLENLLGNAWKFTSKHPAARIEFGVQQQSGKPVYFVRDDGTGFDMKYAQKLFGAFQRLHSPNEFAGTGIGLATVQRIILRHGGKIWAEGEVEKGATFYFTIAL